MPARNPRSILILEVCNHHTHTRFRCSASAAGDARVASASLAGDILFHSLVGGNLLARARYDHRAAAGASAGAGAGAAVRDLHFSPFHKSLLAAGGDDGCVCVWDLDHDYPVYTPPPPPLPAAGAAASAAAVAAGLLKNRGKNKRTRSSEVEQASICVRVPVVWPR